MLHEMHAQRMGLVRGGGVLARFWEGMPWSTFCEPLALQLGWKWASLETRIGPNKSWNWVEFVGQIGLGPGPNRSDENKTILFDKTQ